MTQKYKALFGGTFNPVHVGHIRLAIEVLEYASLPHAIDHVDIIPCATPVFKAPAGLLPFDIRMAMLKVACEDISGLHVSDVEGQRHGVSYTYDTLHHYRQAFPQQKLLFVLGMENLFDLPKWYHGENLPFMADFGVVPRANSSTELFAQIIAQHWPHAKVYDTHSPTPWAELTSSHPEGEENEFSQKTGKIFYMPLPRLDVSATFIRQRWLKGKHLHMLVPEKAVTILTQECDLARKIWQSDS